MHVQQMSASDAERVIAALHGKTLARQANPLFIEIVSQSIGIVYAMCGVCVCGVWVCVSLDSRPQGWRKTHTKGFESMLLVYSDLQSSCRTLVVL